MREKVAELVRELGPRPAAVRLGVSRDVVIGIIADMNVMPGTVALLRERLAAEAA
jgi:hypothetical protein